MKIYFFFVLSAGLLMFTKSGFTQIDASYGVLMPAPREVRYTEGLFRLDANFNAVINEASGNRGVMGLQRFLKRLSERTGLFIAPLSETVSSRLSAALVISCAEEGNTVLHEDESYILTITSTGIQLTAVTSLGVLRGIETLLQLLSHDDAGYFFPACVINDSPRFPWRGLMIDVSRHFFSIEILKRNIDAMAAVKLNVLHLHLSDDQGFRVESKIFPQLSRLASDGLYYTQDEIRDLILYADARGTRIVPEFDIPGHATSYLTVFPELASAPGPFSIERHWGVFDPVFNPTLEETYIFFDAFFLEMTALFPDEYVHIGGDENNGVQWNENPKIQSFMKENEIKDNHALQAYFNNRILAILTKYSKKMMGWDEIFHPLMPKTIAIHSWRGREALLNAAQSGYQTILSNGYYIDLMQPAWKHYLNDPLPDSFALSSDQKKLILGGEATMWAELISPENIDSRIWPRTAAIAERFWSPASVCDVEDMYRRLSIISVQLEEHGVTHISSYEKMLRRLVNGGDTKPLRMLVDVLEPLKEYRRHQYVVHSAFTPLTRTVDAARPESMTARVLQRCVDSFIANPSPENEKPLRLLFMDWKTNSADLLKCIDESPVLFEVKPHALNLLLCAETGLRCLDLIHTPEDGTSNWYSEILAKLETAKEQHGLTELVIIAPIQKLLTAAYTK